MNVFELFASLSLDKSDYDKSLEEAEGSASSFGDKLKSAVAVGGAAMAALGTGIAVASKALVGQTSELASYGDTIDKMSQKLGISAEAYQEWDAILQHSGADISSLGATMKTLVNAAESGNEAFEQLGITQEEIAGMNQEELFAATITALQEMEEGTERTALASKLLGRGAMELGPLLNTSAKDTEAMRQRVHELGGVMSNEAVKAAAKYQDSLQDMQTAMTGLKNNMVSEFLPGFSEVMDGLTEIFSGDDDSGIGKITSGINSIAGKITEALPRIISVGGQIVVSLGTAIAQNLPTLISTGADAITQIVQGLATNAGTFAQSALQIVTSLGTALVTNLPALTSAALDLVNGLVDGLVDVVSDPEFPGKLLDFLGKLAGAIIESAFKIAEAAPELVTKIVQGMIDFVVNGVVKIAEFIGDFVDALINGDDAFLEVGKAWARKILSGLRSILSLIGLGGIDMGDYVMNALNNSTGSLNSSAVSGGYGDASLYGVDLGGANIGGRNSSGNRNVTFGGTVTFEGVNNEGQMVAAQRMTYNDIVQELQKEARWSYA